MRTLLGFVGSLLFLAALYLDARQTHFADAPVPAGAVVWDMLAVSGRTQADSHLLRFPDGKTFLIDAGESEPLVPQLERLGIKHIDRILISHPHHDHYEGLRSLMKSQITVSEVDFNVPLAPVCDREKPWGCRLEDVLQVREELRARGVMLGGQKVGEVFHDGVGRLEVLYVYDGEHTPVGPTDANDTSAILLLTVGNTKVLFPGDLNRLVGGYLAKQNDPRLKAQLLKVPHHGTEGCAPDEFFAWVAPQAAFVPAPAELWRSDRSKRIRSWFEQFRIPTYVSGIAGRVRVVLLPDSYRVYPDRY